MQSTKKLYLMIFRNICILGMHKLRVLGQELTENLASCKGELHTNLLKVLIVYDDVPFNIKYKKWIACAVFAYLLILVDVVFCLRHLNYWFLHDLNWCLFTKYLLLLMASCFASSNLINWIVRLLRFYYPKEFIRPTVWN